MPTGSGTPIIPQTMLELGPAGWFRPEPDNPAANRIVVKFGRAVRGGFAVVEQAADQFSAGFASVASGAGFKRVDLVYLDDAGVVQIAQGIDIAVAAPDFDGAPGFNLGPPMPQGSPVAYVKVTEVGAVTITKEDVFQVNGFVSLGRDLDGYLVDKGLFGGAPAGASDDVSALFAADTRLTPVTGATAPASGGSTTQAGVVTAPPLNYVHVLDQKGDEVKHATGARMYGRLTEAAGVWTLTYFYLDNTGAETAMDPSSDTADTAPTDLRLAGVPRVFARNDAARPLFDSNVARLSDQVAGTVPVATASVEGTVRAGANSPAIPLAGTINVITNASGGGTPVAGGPFHTLRIDGATAGPAGVVDVPAGAGPPGPSGPTGPAGPTGPTGPGFSTLGTFAISGLRGDGVGAGAQSGSEPFVFGFAVRGYTVCLAEHNVNIAGAYDGTWRITSVTVSPGTTVNVAWALDASPPDQTPNELRIRFGVAAFG